MVGDTGNNAAAIRSIGAANLFTRNFWKADINPGVTALGEARVAKMTSFAVGTGALLFILFLPTQFALDLQSSLARDRRRQRRCALERVLE
jgi:hypothetical protein